MLDWRREEKHAFNSFSKSTEVHKSEANKSKAHFTFLTKRINIVKSEEILKIQILSSITVLDIAID